MNTLKYTLLKKQVQLKPMSSDEAINKKPPASLSDILLERKLITLENLEVALKEQTALGETHRRIEEILITLGFVSEHDVLKAISTQLGIKYLTFSEFPKVIPDGSYPTIKFMKQYRLVPIGLKDNVLKVAMSDPMDKYALDALRTF